jgi:hypothetical protein
VAMCVLVVATAGCAAHHSRSADIISAGQLDIQLPPGWKVTHNGAQAPTVAAAPAAAAPVAAAGAGGPGGAGGAGGASPTTAASAIPLAKANPITAFFQATSSFTGCLKGLGVKFIGAPDPKNPSSPANDPTYLKNLSTCAAQSGIVQALKDFQSSQNNLTPAQIQQQNKGYLAWRQCMINRGWTIPQPKPDAQGRLFSFTGTGGGGPQLTPPAGQDALTSSDIRDCAAQVTPANGATGS